MCFVLWSMFNVHVACAFDIGAATFLARDFITCTRVPRTVFDITCTQSLFANLNKRVRLCHCSMF